MWSVLKYSIYQKQLICAFNLKQEDIHALRTYIFYTSSLDIVSLRR